MLRSKKLAIGITIIAVGAVQVPVLSNDEARCGYLHTLVHTVLAAEPACTSHATTGGVADEISILQTSKHLSKVPFNHSSTVKLSTLQVPGGEPKPSNRLLPHRDFSLFGAKNFELDVPEVTASRGWTYRDKCNMAAYGVDYLCLFGAPILKVREAFVNFGDSLGFGKKGGREDVGRLMRWLSGFFYAIVMLCAVICIARGCIPPADTQEVRITATRLKPIDESPLQVDARNQALVSVFVPERVSPLPKFGLPPVREESKWQDLKGYTAFEGAGRPLAMKPAATPSSLSPLSAALIPQKQEPLSPKLGVREGLPPLSSYGKTEGVLMSASLYA